MKPMTTAQFLQIAFVDDNVLKTDRASIFGPGHCFYDVLDLLIKRQLS